MESIIAKFDIFAVCLSVLKLVALCLMALVYTSNPYFSFFRTIQIFFLVLALIMLIALIFIHNADNDPIEVQKTIYSFVGSTAKMVSGIDNMMYVIVVLSGIILISTKLWSNISSIFEGYDGECLTPGGDGSTDTTNLASDWYVYNGSSFIVEDSTGDNTLNIDNAFLFRQNSSYFVLPITHLFLTLKANATTIQKDLPFSSTDCANPNNLPSKWVNTDCSVTVTYTNATNVFTTAVTIGVFIIFASILSAGIKMAKERFPDDGGPIGVIALGALYAGWSAVHGMLDGGGPQTFAAMFPTFFQFLPCDTATWSVSDSSDSGIQWYNALFPYFEMPVPFAKATTSTSVTQPSPMIEFFSGGIVGGVLLTVVALLCAAFGQYFGMRLQLEPGTVALEFVAMFLWFIVCSFTMLKLKQRIAIASLPVTINTNVTSYLFSDACTINFATANRMVTNLFYMAVMLPIAYVACCKAPNMLMVVVLALTTNALAQFFGSFNTSLPPPVDITASDTSNDSSEYTLAKILAIPVQAFLAVGNAVGFGNPVGGCVLIMFIGMALVLSYSGSSSMKDAVDSFGILLSSFYAPFIAHITENPMGYKTYVGGSVIFLYLLSASGVSGIVNDSRFATAETAFEAIQNPFLKLAAVMQLTFMIVVLLWLLLVSCKTVTDSPILRYEAVFKENEGVAIFGALFYVIFVAILLEKTVGRPTGNNRFFLPTDGGLTYGRQAAYDCFNSFWSTDTVACTGKPVSSMMTAITPILLLILVSKLDFDMVRAGIFNIRFGGTSDSNAAAQNSQPAGFTRAGSGTFPPAGNDL